MYRNTILAALVVVAALAVLTPAAAAQSTATPTEGPVEEEAPYYDDENGTTNMTEWVPNDGNATSAGILELFARVPGIFIGSGDMDPSGSGYEGFLLTSLFIGAGALTATIGAGVGIIAGTMLATVLAYGLTFVGMIPVWIRPLLLFTLVGIPAATAIMRVFRG
jgi:hypothetical protein